MILIGLCVVALVHFSCQDLIIIPKIGRDEYNIPIVEESIFEDSIPHLKCLGIQQKLNKTYIEMISECFSDPDSIKYIKTKSKVRISEGKAKPEQLELLRCLGSLTVSQKDASQIYTKHKLNKCLLHHNIEKYIDDYVQERYTNRMQQEFTEFLLCLAATDEVHLQEEATDCIQTNPILVEIGRIFRNPFPAFVIPPPTPQALKSGGELMTEMTDIYHISSSQNEEVTFSDSYYLDYLYYK